jgi:hypothetical protein
MYQDLTKHVVIHSKKCLLLFIINLRENLRYKKLKWHGKAYVLPIIYKKGIRSPKKYCRKYPGDLLFRGNQTTALKPDVKGLFLSTRPINS